MVPIRDYRRYLIRKATENQSDMMRVEGIENGFGHDTRMCGDPNSWFLTDDFKK